MALQKLMKNLIQALVQFQAQHCSALKGGAGNYGSYVTLADTLRAIQPACQFGLAHTQTTHYGEDGTLMLETTLWHVSGEHLGAEIIIPDKAENSRANHMQQLGSALTYARRYALLSIYGLAGEDDDAESAAPKSVVSKADVDFI